MRFAQTTINEIFATYQRATEENEILVQELSRIDLLTQDILHYLELEELTTVIGFSVALKLKELRVTRRKIKDELEPLQIFLSMLDNQRLEKIRQRIANKVHQQENRSYTPRVISGGLVKAVNN